MTLTDIKNPRMGMKSHLMNISIMLKDTKNQHMDTRNPPTAMRNPLLGMPLQTMIIIFDSYFSG